MKTSFRLILASLAIAILASCADSGSPPMGNSRQDGRTRGDFNSNNSMPSNR